MTEGARMREQARMTVSKVSRSLLGIYSENEREREMGGNRIPSRAGSMHASEKSDRDGRVTGSCPGRVRDRARVVRCHRVVRPWEGG